MLKLKSLKFAKIGRFLEPQEINFNSLGNLVQVDAINHNTGGSSGSGKTTIFNAIDYLLGLNDLAIGVLQSRGIEEGGIAVSGDFDWNGNRLTIYRSKSKGLSLEINEVHLEGLNKIVEEKLDEIIGMPRHLFRKILHKRQKEGGFFLQFTPKQVHDFLTDCLGLIEYRVKIDLIDNKIKELESQKNSLDMRILSNQSSLQATKDAVTMLGLPPVLEIDKSILVSLKQKLDNSVIELDNAILACKVSLDSLRLSRPAVEFMSFDHSLIDKLEYTSKDIKNKITRLNEEEKQRQYDIAIEISRIEHERDMLENHILLGEKAKNKAVTIAIDIKKIRNSTCPTCEQPWIDNSIKNKELSLMTDLEDIKNVIAQGTNAKEKLIFLNVRLKELKNDLASFKNEEIDKLNNTLYQINKSISDEKQKRDSHIEKENERNIALSKEFLLEEKSLLAKHEAAIEQIRGQLSTNSMLFQSSSAKFLSFEKEKANYNNNLRSLNDRIVVLSEISNTLNNELNDLNEKTQLTEEAKRAIKSFINHSFDDALENIGETATAIVRNIPNMSNATITLEALKETKEGKVKEEVNAVLSVDGELDIPIKSLSGGERSAIDLSIDLAVIDLIESRTGKGTNFLILDEPFTGLGSPEIEMALEILKNSNLNKKIIIVDHNPIVKEMVSDRILVVRDGLVSTIKRA